MERGKHGRSKAVASTVTLMFVTSLLSMRRAGGDVTAKAAQSSSASASSVPAVPAPSSTASASPTPPAPAATSRILWSESFRGLLDWKDPQEHASHWVKGVYSVGQEGGTFYLHAHHDAVARGAPPAIHFGRALGKVPLAQVRLLRWRWRARIQPAIRDDPWEDMAASVYVVTKAPSLLTKGRGFKFGWLAKPGPSQTYQRGLLQVPIRSEPPTLQWKTEEVELCTLYRRTFGPCEDAQIIYIGVLTDADGVKSIAEGDYADFEIVASE